MSLRAALLALFAVAVPAAANDWPSVSGPMPATGGGEGDAAVVVGISDYFGLPDINGAVENATDWNRYLVSVRGVPGSRVRLLRNSEATKETIEEALLDAAREVKPGATLWFIYIGHGAPAPSLDDGLVLGADTQATMVSLKNRGLPQKRALEIIEGGAHAHAVVMFDACFSGTVGDGKTQLVPNSQATVPVRRLDATVGRTAIFSASDEVAGPLPGHDRPAFTYLMLGAARGWADGNKDKTVTLDEAHAYVKDVLITMVRDRNQVPSLKGHHDFALATGVAETGPSLVDLQEKFVQVKPPEPLPFPTVAPPTIDRKLIDGATFGTSINTVVEKLREDALDAAESATSTPQAKQQAWCALADVKDNNAYLEQATTLCASWRQYIEDEAKLEQRLTTDYNTLVDYLDLRRLTPEQRLGAVRSFLTTFSKYSTRQELLAAKEAETRLLKGEAAGIYKDMDRDGLILDGCPHEAEDLDGDADDDGCPEESVFEATGKAAGNIIDGTGKVIDDTKKAIDESGFRLHLFAFDAIHLDVGVQLGLGLWDEAALIPTKLDEPTLRPSSALTTRLVWGPIEAGLSLDWDLRRDLEDDGGYASSHAGLRVFSFGPWTPSVGVDARNLGAFIGGPGAPEYGAYLANRFSIFDGFGTRLTYRYGLGGPGGIVPNHAVFFEITLLAAGPQGSALLELMEGLFELCE